ncbi:MAG: GNAT family N-acetyltransferase [Acidimicrobiia bacterium]
MTATIRPARPDGEDPAAAARLHAERIGEGFLVTLGPRFLTRLYGRIARSPGGVLLLAVDGERVAGFVAATTSTRRLYAEFLRHDAVPAGLAAAPAVLRSPRRVWETWRYGAGGGHGDLPEAEVLSIAVAADATGNGIGAALLGAALADLRDLGAPSAQVVTAVGNDAALALYERGGFRRHARTEVHAGVAQEVLVWP